MDLNKTKVTFPEKKEMLERLRRLVGGTATYEALFHQLTHYAGVQGTARGVITVLCLNFEGHSMGFDPVNKNILYSEAHLFIDALVDDHDIAIQVKKGFDEMHCAPA